MVSVPCRDRHTTLSVRAFNPHQSSLLTHPLGYAPEKVEYGINRYVNETRRLYRTLDTALEKSTSGFIVGDRLTVADIACWGWVASASESPNTPSIFKQVN